MDIINSLDITEQSKVNYRNIVKILERDGYNFSFTIQDTIHFLANYPIRTALNILNVIFVIRRELGQDMSQYIELRAYMQQEQQEQTHETLSQLDIMPQSEFETLMQALYNNKEYLKYILNYLAFHYGVRNEDLRINIGVEKDNFLIKNKVGVAYIRQNYKTVSTYGVKKHIIKDKQFITAFKELPHGLVYKGHMSNFLKKMLILPEGQIFKMRIKEMEEKGDTKGIRRLAEDRGTALETVLSNYNINNKKYVIK
jgi:hypothetical protein